MKKLDVPQSGSQASTTASRNRFGQYNRTRATPVNPDSSRQVVARGYLSDVSQAWRALNDLTRAGWNSFAAITPKTDSLGQTVYPTGHQRFVGAWSSYTNAGFSTPPAVPTEAPPAPPNATIADISEGDGLVIASTETISTDLRMLVFASQQVSAGVSFMGDYRWLLTRSTALAAGELDITAAYTAKFGALITGRRIFLRCYLITETGGRGAATALTGVVTA